MSFLHPDDAARRGGNGATQIVPRIVEEEVPISSVPEMESVRLYSAYCFHAWLFGYRFIEKCLYFSTRKRGAIATQNIFSQETS